MILYGPVTTLPQLIAEDEQFPGFVGVTKDGRFHVYDKDKKAAKPISFEEAAVMLNVDLDTITEIAKSGGTYELPRKEEVAPSIEEEIERLDIEALEKRIEELENKILDLETKLEDKENNKEDLKEDIVHLKEEIKSIHEQLSEIRLSITNIEIQIL